MLQEQQVILRILEPDVKGNWLYKQDGEDRVYSQKVYLGKDADPSDWVECTKEEKEQWESQQSIELPE